MVAFNEPPQKQGGTDIPAVHFPFMSREISNLTPDRSKEFLFQGLGKAMEQGSQLADTAYDSVVKNDTRSTVDPLQKQYQQDLQAVDDQLHGVGQLDPNSSSLVSMTAQQYGQLPGDLKSLPRQLDMRESARANGKISETQHYRDIIDMATRLRAKYPGKTDLIDAEISRITGVHPANQYVRSLLGDINSFVDAGKEARSKVETVANKGLQDGDVSYPQYKQWQETGDDSIIYKAVAAGGEARSRYIKREHERNEGNWDVEDKRKAAVANATQKGYDIVNHFMESTGINGKQIDQAIADMVEHPYDYDPEEVAAKLDIGIRQAESKFRRELGTATPGMKSAAQDMGPEETERVITSTFKELKEWRQAIKEGNIDIAQMAARQVKAIQASGELALYKDPQVGPVAAELRAIKEALGPEAFSIYWQQNQKAWNSLVTMNEKSAFMDDAKRLVQRPSATVGPIDNFNKMLKENQAKKVATPKLVDQQIDLVSSLLGDKTPPEVKASVVKRVFGQGNEDTLDLFKKTADKYNVYGRLTSTEGSDSIWKASRKDNNHDMWINYSDWAGHSFGILMRDELKDLSTSTEDYSRVKIKWDPDNHQFIGIATTQTPEQKHLMGQGATQLPGSLQRTINRVNGALYNLNHIYEKTSQSTDIYLYKLLTGSGLRGPVADQMIDAITEAHSSGPGKKEQK